VSVFLPVRLIATLEFFSFYIYIYISIHICICMSPIPDHACGRAVATGTTLDSQRRGAARDMRET
jgi:hypothetical protein